jgi:hypothetical protein
MPQGNQHCQPTEKSARMKTHKNSGQKAVYVVGCSIVGPYEVYDIVGIKKYLLANRPG